MDQNQTRPGMVWKRFQGILALINFIEKLSFFCTLQAMGRIVIGES
ncbi:MAG: hypothetical protein K9N06_13695 [Candidatus Cloacimonetes bacterium]|nr:hypothetical protein [Candidatus Cloacimonadota bacterium]